MTTRWRVRAGIKLFVNTFVHIYDSRVEVITKLTGLSVEEIERL